MSNKNQEAREKVAKAVERAKEAQKEILAATNEMLKEKRDERSRLLSEQNKNFNDAISKAYEETVLELTCLHPVIQCEICKLHFNTTTQVREVLGWAKIESK